MQEKQFELEKQLHEQYAINNNSNLGSIIAILTTLVSVIGVYGYIFVHSTLDFAKDWGNFLHYHNDSKLFALDVLFFSAIASHFILVLLYFLSAYLGTNQRKEQFITFAIRDQYYKENYENYTNIFPKNYHPFNKDKSNFIQGLYGEICRALKILFCLISLATLCKLISHFLKYCKEGNSICFTNISMMVFIISFILSRVFFCYIRSNFYKDYNRRQDEYKGKPCHDRIESEKENNSKEVCCICDFLSCIYKKI